MGERMPNINKILIRMHDYRANTNNLKTNIQHKYSLIEVKVVLLIL